MSKLLFVFSDLERESIDQKDKEAAKRDIEIAFGCFMEDFFEGWEVSFGDATVGDVFGFEEPEALILAASKWNFEVRQLFTGAYVNYMRLWGHKMRSAEAEGLDNQDMFKLRMAASTMDNHFSPAGDMFVYNQTENTVSTIITEEMLEYIRENPELCALTTVSCI